MCGCSQYLTYRTWGRQTRGGGLKTLISITEPHICYFRQIGSWIGVIEPWNTMKAKARPWKPFDWQHGIFGNKIPTSLTKFSRIWLLLRGRTSWIERNDLTFNNSKAWPRLLEYPGVMWDIVCKDADRASIYDDEIEIYDNIWGVKEFLYHKDGTNTMHWHIREPNVSLANHV